MKRTNIVVDEHLIGTAIETQRGVIDYALRELVRRERQLDLLKLKGKLHWEGDLAALRETRVP